MSDPVLNPPGVVRPAEDLAGLLATANAEHEKGTIGEFAALEHYRRAGEALCRAKKLAGHGGWLKLLKGRLRFPHQRASEYMRLSRGWSKLPPGGNFALKEALRLLDEDERESQAAAQPAGPLPRVGPALHVAEDEPEPPPTCSATVSPAETPEPAQKCLDAVSRAGPPGPGDAPETHKVVLVSSPAAPAPAREVVNVVVAPATRPPAAPDPYETPRQREARESAAAEADAGRTWLKDLEGVLRRVETLVGDRTDGDLESYPPPDAPRFRAQGITSARIEGAIDRLRRVRLAFESREYSLWGDPAGEAAWRAQALHMLPMFAPASAAELAPYLNTDEAKASAILGQLLQEGKVVCSGSPPRYSPAGAAGAVGQLRAVRTAEGL